MPFKVLIMGLPGSGKTFLASSLIEKIANRSCLWLNADKVRTAFNDWDFSKEGRIRQSLRMRDLADESNVDIVICDFVAPLPEMRNNFDPDLLVWMDTIDSGRYVDTNAIFVPPENFDFRITEFSKESVDIIIRAIT